MAVTVRPDPTILDGLKRADHALRLRRAAALPSRREIEADSACLQGPGRR